MRNQDMTVRIKCEFSEVEKGIEKAKEYLELVQKAVEGERRKYRQKPGEYRLKVALDA